MNKKTYKTPEVTVVKYDFSNVTSVTISSTQSALNKKDAKTIINATSIDF